MAGTEAGSWRLKLKQRPQKDAADWLVPSGSLHYLPLHKLEPSAQGPHCRQWAGHSSINEQFKKTLHRYTHEMEIISRLRFPLPRHAYTCVNY